jgi:Gas vesicle protein
MSTPMRRSGELARSSMVGREPAQLADVLERVLDKGIVIAGDIQINLLDIELLTIKLRLLIASADKAREMGIDWWEGDPFLGRAQKSDALEDRLKRLEREAGIDGDSRSDQDH